MLKTAAKEPERPQNEGSYVPLPTPHTKALRTFLPWQIYRFILINVKMFEMITKSHE
ncbi:MAG: hypothetical protein WCE44_12625 [Candidatus Velthaea sp.]|jgi:hypothetical protein